MFRLTPQQIDFFETFGFLKLEAALADDIGWITEEFEAVFSERQIHHDGTQRSCIVPFVDQRARLCTLLEHPIINGAASSLLGEDFNYLGSDGNYYSGDTNWHSDGYHAVGLYLKIAFYLDHVTRDTGALRVIPGSHLPCVREHWAAHHPGRSAALWDLPGADVPAVALENRPGDLLLFNHNLWHAAYGGSARRRMFTLNLCRHCESSEEIEDLRGFIGSNARFWIDHMHGETMKATAPPRRWVHLRQVMDNEDHLPQLAAQARRAQPEPARG